MSARIDPSVYAAIKRTARQFLRTLHDDDVLAFAEALDDLTSFDVVRALAEIGKYEKFFPRPVVVRHYVEKLRSRAAPPTARPVPETDIDPTTGERVELYRCRECQDKRFVPVTEAGAVISWDAVRGVGEFSYCGIRGTIKHHYVKHCATCNPPRPAKVTRRSYEDEQDDRRR